MLSLLEQLSFKTTPSTKNKPISSNYKRLAIPKYVGEGYSSSSARREAMAKANYIAALSKRKWSSAKDLMMDLGLKSPVCATKTMNRPYMIEITNKRVSRGVGKGGNFYIWSLKTKV